MGILSPLWFWPADETGRYRWLIGRGRFSHVIKKKAEKQSGNRRLFTEDRLFPRRRSSVTNRQMLLSSGDMAEEWYPRRRPTHYQSSQQQLQAPPTPQYIMPPPPPPPPVYMHHRPPAAASTSLAVMQHPQQHSYMAETAVSIARSVCKFKALIIHTLINYTKLL